MSDSEEDHTDFQQFSKNYTGWINCWSISRKINRSMGSCKWNHYENSTTFWWVNLLVQVWWADWWLAGSDSAWSSKTRTSIEKQTCRRCRNAQGTSQSRFSESRRWSQVFHGYFETPFHQRSSDCFPLEIFINFFGQGEKTMRWSRGSVNSDCSCEASARCLDGLVTNVRHARRGDHPRKDISIQRYLDNIHCCKWSQWIPERATQEFALSQGSESRCSCIWCSKDSANGIVLYAEKFIPSEQTRRQHEQNLNRRRLYWRRIWTMGHRRGNWWTRSHMMMKDLVF